MTTPKVPKTGPRRDYEGMITPTTVAQHEAAIRADLNEMRIKWDHGRTGARDGVHSSRSAQLAVRQELKIDGPWSAVFDLLVSRVVNK